MNKPLYQERVIASSTPFECLNEAHFAEYAAAGLGAFELSVDAEYYGLLDIPAIVKAAQSQGITPWSFHLPYYYLPDAVISVPDVQRRASAVRFQGEQIRRAADAGFSHIVIHPSSEPIKEDDRAAQFAAAKASIEELSLVAKHAGVTLAVENLPRTCLGNTSSELLALIADAEGAGVCFDMNHLLLESHADFLRAVGEHIVTVHVSDYDRVDERHWLPGEGVTDWGEVLALLDACGYQGPWMYELNRSGNKTISREKKITPAQMAQNAHELWHGLPITKRGTVLV